MSKIREWVGNKIWLLGLWVAGSYLTVDVSYFEGGHMITPVVKKK